MWWNKYIQVPFSDKGRDWHGCDCYGLVRLIYQEELRIELPDYLECYPSSEDLDASERLTDWVKYTEFIEVKEPKEFDCILLSVHGFPMHVGVVTKQGFMLHCQKGIGTVHEKYDTPKHKNRIRGFWRVKGLCKPTAI